MVMAAVSAEVSGTPGVASRNRDVPEVGQLVKVRGQQWVVSGISNSRQPQDELAATRLPGRTLVSLTSVSDDSAKRFFFGRRIGSPQARDRRRR